MARWPSGLRRYVQVVVFSGGVGSNPTLVIPLCSHPNLPLEEFVLCVLFLFLCKGGWARVHMLVERTTQAITPQAPVAQWLRRQTSNLKVAGSTPVGSVLLFFHTLVLCLGSVLQQHTPNPFVCKVSEFVTHPHTCFEHHSTYNRCGFLSCFFLVCVQVVVHTLQWTSHWTGV